MKTKAKRKTFDCVEMKRRAAERLKKKLEPLTPEQQLEFWAERTRALRERQQVLIRERPLAKRL